MKTLERIKEILHDWMVDAGEENGNMLEFAMWKDDNGESMLEKAIYVVLEESLPSDLFSMMHGEKLVKVIEQVSQQMLEQLKEDSRQA
jgi:hypothetical protein